MKTLGSSVSSPAEMAHGERCWNDLVESCHAAKVWEDVSEDDEDATDDTTNDADAPLADTVSTAEAATISTSVATATAVAVAVASPDAGKTDTTAESEDFFASGYQSFDWTDEETEFQPSSLLVEASAHSSPDSRFIPRYMPTIIEEDEEEDDILLTPVTSSLSLLPSFYTTPSPTFEEDQKLFESDDDEIVVNLPKVDCPVCEYKSTPLPQSHSQPIDTTNQPSPPLNFIEDLFNIVPANVLQRIGLPSDAISRREPIVLNLPLYENRLRRISKVRSNLDLLANLASAQTSSRNLNSPTSNLDVLAITASCC